MIQFVVFQRLWHDTIAFELSFSKICGILGLSLFLRDDGGNSDWVEDEKFMQWVCLVQL